MSLGLLKKAPKRPEPDGDLTTLGWMKFLMHIHIPWYEYMYLRFIHSCLTEHWALLQGGIGEEALQKWHEIFEILELDQKARRDFMLLLHSGLVGRTRPTRSCGTCYPGGLCSQNTGTCRSRPRK